MFVSTGGLVIKTSSFANGYYHVLHIRKTTAIQHTVRDIAFQVGIQRTLEGAIEDVVFISHCRSRDPKLIKTTLRNLQLTKHKRFEPIIPLFQKVCFLMSVQALESHLSLS